MAEHYLPIDDIRHAWSEKRTPFDDEGVGEPYTVFVGVCTCSARFEADTPAKVVTEFQQHRRMAAGA